jgi:hypothetical protein
MSLVGSPFKLSQIEVFGNSELHASGNDPEKILPILLFFATIEKHSRNHSLAANRISKVVRYAVPVTQLLPV